MAELNAMSAAEFAARVGGVFENSPWIAESAADRRPFAAREALHSAMTDIVASSPPEKQVALIAAHPDLAGRLARQGLLTAESTHEQASAGLGRADAVTLRRIEELNASYRQRFGFPFVICARLNNVEAILEAFVRRLENSRDGEIATALGEIYKIARLRLEDIVED